MSPPRHNKDQGLLHYPDGSWGVDAYIGGRRLRKKVGGKQAAREELALLKAEAKKTKTLAVTGPDFDTVRHALATIEDQVAALRDQLATARAREHVARSALARLIEAASDDPHDFDTQLAAAKESLEQLYLDTQ